MYPIANGNDDIEIVKVHYLGSSLASYGTVRSDLCKFCNSHFWIYFTFRNGVLHMTENHGLVLAEQLRHLSLREPYILVVHLHGQGHLAVLRLKKHDFVLHLCSLLSVARESPRPAISRRKSR